MQAIPVLPLSREAGHRVQCVRAEELSPWERNRSAAGAVASPASGEVALKIDGLEKLYRQRRGFFGSGGAPVRALNGIDLIATKGETLAIVGESGCGKSTLGRCIIRLLDLTSGSVTFDAKGRIVTVCVVDIVSIEGSFFHDISGSLGFEPYLDFSSKMREALQERGRTLLETFVARAPAGPSEPKRTKPRGPRRAR